MKKIRKDVIYGLLVIIPLASILWLIELSISVITGPVSQLIGFELNNISGLILSLLIIWGIGFMIRLIINRSIFPKIEAFILKIPGISLVYQSFRQIASILLKKKKRFLATVYIEYPLKGIWSLGFLTNDNVTCLNNKVGTQLVENPISVFIPSTPNPTNGVFVFVDKPDIQMADMSVEDGIKCLMSAGMITPKIKKEI